MSHEEYKGMLELEALDALDGMEGRAMREHLEDCAECRAELSELRDTAAMLVHLVPAATPPAHLRARILEAVAAEDGQSDARAGRVAQAERDAKTPIVASPGVKETGTLPFVNRRSSYGWATLLAASLLIGALLVSLFLVWQRKNQAEAELAREREVRELLAAPGASMVELSGTETAPQAQAKLAYDRQTGRAMLFAYNLPPTPAGKAYQLWFITPDGRVLPGGVFATDPSGRAEMRDQIPAEGRNAQTFAVTLEPAGGVAVATGAKYLLGSRS